jgi:hypothetical protein
VFKRVGKEREVARSLHSRTYEALVALTRPCLAAWFYLAAVADIHAQAPDVLVVHSSHVIHAEAADFAPTSVPFWRRPFGAFGPLGPVAFFARGSFF